MSLQLKSFNELEKWSLKVMISSLRVRVQLGFGSVHLEFGCKYGKGAIRVRMQLGLA